MRALVVVGFVVASCGGGATAPRPAAPPALDPIDDPELARPSAAAPASVEWQLTGRHRPGRLDVPALPAAADTLPGACGDEEPPCFAERWAAGGESRLYVRWRDAAWLVPLADPDGLPRGLPGGDSGARVARASWVTLGALLTACLGDPLHVPPAWDPGGARGYDGRDWILAFTGQNPCELEGSLRLRVEADRVDAARLTVGGSPWRAGGSARAESRLHAYNAVNGR